MNEGHPRARRLMAPLLALVVLWPATVAAASPAGAGVRPDAEGEGAPTIVKPANQHSVLGTPVTFKGAGTEMVSIKAEGLPEGLKAAVVSTTEWTVTGTPTKITPAGPVKVTVENAAGKEKAETSFEWTVEGLTDPGPQSAIAGAPLKAPIVLAGVGLHALAELKPLPKGLTLEKISEAEWRIVGTPAGPGVGEVELQAENATAEKLPPVKFTLTVDGIENPGTQKTIAGQEVSLIIEGTGMKTLKQHADSFPPGLELKDLGTSETEWEIVGKPALSGAYAIELEGQNAKEEALTPVDFTFDVAGFHEPGPQFATVGVPTTVFVLGFELVNVTAGGLPAGLELVNHEGAVIEIAGTPTAAGESEVELQAEDEAKQPLPPIRFKLTIAAAPAAPSATGTPAVSPADAFALSRLSCGGAGWSVPAVSTQWLLDGAPIAGATSTTFTPPRADDGHSLSCRQTATGSDGVSASLTSAGRVIHEQPAQPVWPIGPASGRCTITICMQDGAGPQTPASRTYSQDGAWFAASQVRCVSAPWTSIAGGSPLALVAGYAEAHTVTVTLQRVGPAGAVTVASAELGSLGAARDELDGSSAGSPFAGQIAAGYGPQAFAAGELWDHVFPGALGKPDRFLPGQGYIAYQLASGPGVKRSFQLVYNLTAADLGARLRCVVSAQDGPPAAPTSASFESPEYTVSTSPACAPRKLTHIGGPQPALVLIGTRHCLQAPAGLAEAGGASSAVSAAAERTAFELECALSGGCSGKLSLLGPGGQSLAGATVSLHHGGHKLVTLTLDSKARALLRRAGSGGLSASLALARAGTKSRLLTMKLLAAS